MRYLMLVAILSFGLLSTSCAQNEKAAPAAVQTAFKAKFPAAQKARWDKEDEGEWEAEFRMNGKEMSANFKTGGTWVETETEIEESDLPQAVRDAIAAQFAGYDAEEAALVETPDQPTAYEVELEKGESTIEVAFTANGKLLKQKSKEDEDDEGDEEGGN